MDEQQDRKPEQARRKKKKNMEEKVSDAAVDNIFSGFKRRINKAKKQYEDIPSGMKKDSKTRTEIQAKLANKALQDDKPFQEFKDTRREVFATQRMAKGGRASYNSGGAVLKGKKVGCQIKYCLKRLNNLFVNYLTSKHVNAMMNQ